MTKREISLTQDHAFRLGRGVVPFVDNCHLRIKSAGRYDKRDNLIKGMLLAAAARSGCTTTVKLVVCLRTAYESSTASQCAVYETGYSELLQPKKGRNMVCRRHS